MRSSEMSTYGDVHRRFLQSFVYRSVQSEAEAQKTYRLVCQEQEKEVSDFNNLIETINDHTRKHTFLQIKTGVCELTGEKYFVACNTSDLKWTKYVSLYTKNEQALFKKILDDILRSESGNVSTIACLNSAGVANMSKSDVSTSIGKFVTHGWFAEKKGLLYMGVRGAVELEPFVAVAYADLKSFCPLCKNMIFWGHRCGSCPEVSHLHCLKKFFGSTGARPACPTCSAEWTDWELAKRVLRGD